MFDEEENFVNDEAQIGRLAREGTLRGKIDEAPHDAIGAINRPAHLVEDSGDIRIIGIDALGKVIDAEEKEGEGVFHLMGDPGGEASDRLKLLGLDELHLRFLELFIGRDEVPVELLELLARFDLPGDVLADPDDEETPGLFIVNGDFDGAEMDLATVLRLDDLLGDLHQLAALDDGLVDAAEVVGRFLREKIVVVAPERFGGTQGGHFLLLFVPEDKSEIVGRVLGEDRDGEIIEDRLDDAVFFHDPRSSHGYQIASRMRSKTAVRAVFASAEFVAVLAAHALGRLDR